MIIFDLAILFFLDQNISDPTLLLFSKDDIQDIE